MTVWGFSGIVGIALLPLAGAAEPEHWAFRPIVAPVIPAAQDLDPVRNPIDALVRARLEAAVVEPSPEAPPLVLLRRLHLDLTGLPPSLAEVEAFLAGWKRDPEATYAEKVAGLLDSPHFGEQWGRHWLDLARYADSDGYLGDGLRPYAWIYRDWVVGAMNEDLPFDRFTIEQLAGDLLPDATPAQKIATGFHRNTLKNTEAGADRELARTKEVVDRVGTTGTVWLGLTLACAECHDHKHDPITQREFYQLYDFFNNADEVDLSVSVPMPDEEARHRGEKTAWEARKAELEEQVAGEPGDGELKKALEKHLAAKPEKPNPKARTFRKRTEDRRETFIHLRGEYQVRGETVTAGVPAVLPAMDAADPDRLDLAEWLFREDNPLTARVAANRVWQHLFGVGLVASSDDFGTNGDRPALPELLDWLAVEYRRLGWSRKELIRVIVSSATYRQASVNTHPARPNLLLWRQNSHRVDAETVRDLHLAASGLLARELGGPGVYPPLPAFVTEVGRSVAWPVSEGSDRYRRGLYIFLKRTVLYPMLTSFDAPDTSASCSRRDRTNTPMQALTLLNDPVFFECAEVLGRDLHHRCGGDVEAAVRELVLRCLHREATPEEMTVLTQVHDDLAKVGSAELAMIATARVVMNLDEFVTRD